ncbi:MAG: M42 family metallopeptidase [Anaerolineales bacterium]|nr:M42 family metallopeptidase [Anaerolineales bacterium]
MTMTETLPFLKSMLSAPGLSGYEAPIAALIEQQWTPLANSVTRSRLGSLHALKAGSTSKKHSPPSIMIATHMDAIGLMVSQIVDGFLYLTAIGGVDPRVLPGTPVTVHASSGEDLYGVVVLPPANLLPDGEGHDAVGLKYLLVETGLTSGAVAKRVQVGDRVSFNTEPVELAGGCLGGHSLDNRASVAALTVCLQELQSRTHVWDVWAVASVQEEVSFAGAFTSAFELRPTIAVVVDVTFGKGAGAGGHKTFKLGKGVTLGIGASMHPFLYKRLKETAERVEIPVAQEAMPEASWTDADAIQLTAEGIPTMVIGIPLRYMHTPVEVVAMKDIQRAGRLLAEFAASLEADFAEKIVWE